MSSSNSFPGSFSASGSLFALRSPRGTMPVEWTGIEGIVIKENARAGWWNISYFTRDPLDPLGEISEQNEFSYTYRFLARQANGRYLLVGDRKGTVERFLDRIGQKWFVRQPVVSTQAIASTFILERHEGYVISALWAKVNGFGGSLKSASFYGDDFGAAALIKDLLPVLAVTRVQLRQLSNDLDILSISAKGEVAFQYHGVESLRAIDVCLSVLTALHFLTWEATQNSNDSNKAV